MVEKTVVILYWYFCLKFEYIALYEKHVHMLMLDGYLCRISYVIGCCSIVFSYIGCMLTIFDLVLDVLLYLSICAFSKYGFFVSFWGLSGNVSNSSPTQMGTFCTCSQTPWDVGTHVICGNPCDDSCEPIL